MAKRKPKLTQREIGETITELSDEIKAVAAIGKALRKSNLKERTIVLLLSSMTGVSRGHIAAILEALPQLSERYLKK